MQIIAFNQAWKIILKFKVEICSPKDNKIDKVLILDNAGGMDPLTLRKSLVFGQGSKLEETKKIE